MGLHFLEQSLNGVVWVCHSLYAVYLAYQASQSIRPVLVAHRVLEAGWSSLGGWKEENFEWFVFGEDSRVRLPFFLLHALVFNVGRRFLAPNLWWVANVTLWGGSLVFIHGVGPPLYALGLGLVLLLILQSKHFMSRFLGPYTIPYIKSLIWGACIGWLYWMAEADHAIQMERKDYVYVWQDNVLYAYKVFQYISFCMDCLDEKNEDSFWDRGWNLLRYCLYFPYSQVLIVPYHKFRESLRRREKGEGRKTWTQISLFILRISFWCLLTEAFLHYFYVNTYMNAPDLMEKIGYFSMASVGYIAGQFFHLKYMTIFGLYTIFAYIDGMESPWPSVCISRVALYSRMWRYFDRGLYSFLSIYIFRPLAPRSASLARQMGSTLLTFSFVYVWHGMSQAFRYWVTLNVAEVILERVGKELWRRYGGGVSKRLSPNAVLRLQSVATIPCVTLGVLSISFFLGDNEGVTGRLFYDKLLTGDAFGIVWLWTLGYFYAHTCMAIDEQVGF